MLKTCKKIPSLLLVWALAAALLCSPVSVRQALAASTGDSDTAAETQTDTESSEETVASANTSSENTSSDTSSDAASENTASENAASENTSSDESDSLWPSGPEAEDLIAKTAVLMEVDTGTIVYNKKMNKKMYPASITKILTCILVLENLDLDDTITFSEEAIYNTEGSGIARDVGEELKVRHCVYAMMLESANECAYALAEAVAGSEEAFVEMMNERAEELGCKHTHFTNCTGLPDEDHYTTAYDMALIAQDAYQNEKFVKIISRTTWTIPKTNKHDEKLTLYNHHAMICSNRTLSYLYEYAIGGKTGYTVASWNTLLTYAQKNNKTYVCVVLKTNSTNQYTETKQLFEFGFANFHNVETEGDDRFDTDALTDGYTLAEGEEILSASAESTTLTLPKGVTLEDANGKVSWETDADGNQTGTLAYYYEGNQVGEAQITVKTNLSESAADEETLDEETAAAAADPDADADDTDGGGVLTTVKNGAGKVTGALDRFAAALQKVDLTNKFLGIPLFVYLIILVAVILLLARIAVIRKRRRRHIEERRKRREQ